MSAGHADLRTSPSICRLCLAYCPIEVTVEHGQATKVAGSPADTPYDGYICPKGRALPEQHNDPSRLLGSVKRYGDGDFRPIASLDAVAAVREKLERIVQRDGANAIALYCGTGPVSNPTGQTLAHGFFEALKSPMVFSATTIDKPAQDTCVALHGNWIGGPQSFELSDTRIIVGGNPVIAKSTGAPFYNPGRRLKEAVNRGMKLIVIDPRKTETARRAHVHLQIRPGEDPTVLAGIIRIIIDESLYDREFLDESTTGFDVLQKAVAPFTPAYVAERAGITTDDLLEAARTFGRAKKGNVVCSTGPSFAEHSDLSYYLSLCLNTICGRWAREGERATFQNVLLPAFIPRAQAFAPFPVFGDTEMRVLGLRKNASGLPTAALADEILLDGPGQIKALFCAGGNPLSSWPDRAKTRRALEKLELLVVFDYKMTATAELADYVIAPPLTLEIPASTRAAESLKYYGLCRGYEVPWAQYTGKVVDPPAGSDLMDEGEFFFRLAQAMELELEWTNTAGHGPHLEVPSTRIPLDMTKVPTAEDLVELSCRDSRIPLDRVRHYPAGHVFDELDVRVQPPDLRSSAKLELADPMMMQELDAVRQLDFIERRRDLKFPFLLIPRRTNNFMNSMGQGLPSLNRGKHYNPAFLHPSDIKALHLGNGETVKIRSSHGEISGVVESDASLRPGTIAMTHGFGPRPCDPADKPRKTGSSIATLIDMEAHDPITGMPRMSGVPVAITKIASTV